MLQMPTPVKVTVLAATVQIVAALEVAKTTGLPEAPPTAVSWEGAAPTVTGNTVEKPVISCAAGIITIVAVTCGAAANVALPA